MTAAELLRITHPELVEQSIAVFDHVAAESARIGRELEEIRARAERRAAELLNPVSQRTGD
jgi:hypothetical protein